MLDGAVTQSKAGIQQLRLQDCIFVPLRFASLLALLYNLLSISVSSRCKFLGFELGLVRQTVSGFILKLSMLGTEYTIMIGDDLHRERGVEVAYV